MATAVKTQSNGAAKMQSESLVQEEPKKLSKAGQWRRDNPGGIAYIKDRRAINRMRY